MVAPSLHASRIMAFEDGDEDEEEQFRPLKKRLDDLNASLLASATAAPAPAAAAAPAASKPTAALSSSFHATVASVDAGLAAEEERQRMMEMMKDMFQSAASGPSSSTGMPGKRLGQGKGLGVGQGQQKLKRPQQQPAASVMEVGKWRRPGAWAARGGAMAAEKGMPN